MLLKLKGPMVLKLGTLGHSKEMAQWKTAREVY